MAEYLICIDFEASCYPSKYQSYKGWYQEILGHHIRKLLEMIDGQDVFRDTYGRNAKLHDAADYVDTSIVGDAHDALDDAKTLAYLMYDMWDNHSFDINVKRCR